MNRVSGVSPDAGMSFFNDGSAKDNPNEEDKSRRVKEIFRWNIVLTRSEVCYLTEATSIPILVMLFLEFGNE